MSAYKNLYEECLTQLIANEYAKDRDTAVEVFNGIKKDIATCECDMVSVGDILSDYGLEMDYAELFMF